MSEDQDVREIDGDENVQEFDVEAAVEALLVEQFGYVGRRKPKPVDTRSDAEKAADRILGGS
ncbi:hypothetical protein [Isoptericola sp. NPDC019482]|uniref:hypothetical protein n=1 Tax=Isoptericola sp. NPDC019482 TaxID=3154688 RepID=UPI0034952411